MISRLSIARKVLRGLSDLVPEKSCEGCAALKVMVADKNAQIDYERKRSELATKAVIEFHAAGTLHRLNPPIVVERKPKVRDVEPEPQMPAIG